MEEVVQENEHNITNTEEQNVKKWIDKGLGELKLNVCRDSDTKSRIIVRTERTHQLIINMPLFRNITCEIATDTSFRVIGYNQGPQSETLSPEAFLIR